LRRDQGVFLFAHAVVRSSLRREFQRRDERDLEQTGSMAEQTHPAFDAAGECVDARALAHHLGSADELTTLSATACPHHLAKIHSVPALRDFLHWYRQDVLGRHEFEQVHAAATLAAKNYIRELLALDAELANEPALRDFQLASRHVGKRQLNRMRPLRDLKLVQRYREAVNEGKSYGWHTLVYGVVLSTYSLPLRQGLLHYGRQTLGGFIHAAARTLELREEISLELQVEMNRSLPSLIEQTLAVNGSAIKLLP
jgi:urease accessory protein UreF